MNKSSSSSSSSGISLLGLLGVVFVVLKLTNVIDWSWWWVTLPFWGIPIILISGVLLFYIISTFKPRSN